MDIDARMPDLERPASRDLAENKAIVRRWFDEVIGQGRWAGLIGSVLALLTVSSSQAAPLPIPRTMYPAGAHVSYRAHLSNHDMDCLWGFVCEGAVQLFHTESQDALQRVSGWAEFAVAHRAHHPDIGFELFSSHYAAGGRLPSPTRARAAFDDFLAAVKAHGYARIHSPGRKQLCGPGGQSIVERVRVDDSDLVVMACWVGQTEVEAIAEYGYHFAADRHTGLTLLARQVRMASSSVS